MMKNMQKEQISRLISSLFRVSSKFSRVDKQPLVLENKENLSTREIHTVQAVGEGRVKNVTETAEYFGVTKGAASQMISRLVEKEYVRKAVSAHSNKEYVLSLTGRGEMAFQEHARQHGRELNELQNMLAELSTAELQHALSVLEIFESTVDKRLQQ